MWSVRRICSNAIYWQQRELTPLSTGSGRSLALIPAPPSSRLNLLYFFFSPSLPFYPFGSAFSSFLLRPRHACMPSRRTWSCHLTFFSAHRKPFFTQPISQRPSRYIYSLCGHNVFFLLIFLLFSDVFVFCINFPVSAKVIIVTLLKSKSLFFSLSFSLF